MTSLRILEINNVELSEDIEYLSQLLRLINWHGYPLKCLPPTFQSPYLFELLLPESQISQLWKGKKNFEKLKVIDVSKSEHLCMTPDFSGVPNLERLVLRNCVRLYMIHPSLICLNSLILLDLKGCCRLKHFPSTISCKNLQTLVLSGTGLQSSPEMGRNMGRLTQLYLDESKITQLHPSIGHLTGLALLNLSSCFGLSSLPFEIGNLRSLKTLYLENCSKLDQIPSSLANAESLETLYIRETSISHLPSSMHRLTNLKWLTCGGLSRGIWNSLLPQFNNNIIHPTSKSFGLGCLKVLNLSGCKLVDEDVPEDLHCFSSLEILNLSSNDFITLPDSLSHLKKLKTLYLNHCTKLKDLPKLPENLLYAEGVDCKSISKKFYNKRLYNPSSSGYYVLNFPIRFKTRKFSVSNTFKEKCIGNDNFNVKYNMICRRHAEACISDEQGYYFNDIKVDIFECLDQRNEGNLIDIQFNRESWSNSDISNVCGVFLSANIEYYQQTLHHFEIHLAKFSIKLEFDEDPLNVPIVEYKEFEFPLSGTIIWAIYMPVKKISHGLMAQNSFSIKATITCTDNKYVKVKACGASVLSWQNASEFLVKLFTKLYCSTHKFKSIILQPNHQSECKCDELEVSKEDFLSSTFESSGTGSPFLLYRTLKSMLATIFEEEVHYCERYFFPKSKIPGWFKNQNKKNKVAVKLPPNIQKDKNWMGLAMFAIFSISKNATYHSFDYEIQSDLRDVLPKYNYFIPIELLEYSNHILFIVFEPRDWYPYQQNFSCNHFYISFNTNVERMQVELCGARLVYKQNLEGLIQTIMDCMVESGDELFECYSRQIMGDLLVMMKTNMLEQLSFLQNSSVNQPTTPLTATDSSLSIEQLILQGSFPHPLLQMSIEERFERKFDLILHGDKIPEIFTNRSIGNMARMKLLPNLDYHENSNFIGVAVCGLVVVDKQTRKLNDIQERERYTKIVDLICRFRVDSYEMQPEHSHFVAQDKLLSQYASQFIWLFYIPLTEFLILWYNCNYLGITLETSCDELFRVQHCGLHLIHNKQRKEIDEMIMASTIPPSISIKGKGPRQ